MRTCLKIIAVIAVLVSVVACGKQPKSVSVEKDGSKYEIADQISFYYPKDFQMNTTLENKEIIQFVRNQEVISYRTIVDDTDNDINDLPELYAGQLEEDGADNVGYKNVEITSGLVCQEFTGNYISTGIQFKHMVYFTVHSTYVLSYEAPTQEYEKNIGEMTHYLNSLVVRGE